MAKLILNGSTSGSVTLDVPAVSGTTTLTFPATTGTLLQSGTAVTAAQGGTGLTSVGSSGNLLTSNGTAWTSTAPAASGGMTLLGTLTTTTGTIQTLSSLTLTSYKQIQIVGSSISTTGTGGILLNSTTRVTDDASSSADSVNFFTIFDLTTGIYHSFYKFTLGAEVIPYFRSNTTITTASTSIGFLLTNSASYDAGTIRVYGVS